MKSNFEHIDCYLCGNNDERFLFNAKDRLLGIKGRFRVVQCRNCGLVYLNPRPSEALLKDFYTQEYYHIHGLPRQLEGKLDLVKRRALITWQKRIAEIEDYHAIKEDTNILDVGCGTGKFLYAIKNIKKCNVHGIDFDREVVKFCNDKLNLTVRDGVLLESGFSSDFFDIITMWHYLEHEMEPLSVLEETRRILKDDGILILDLPNIGSICARFFKSRWFALETPRHLVHYNPCTIEKMLNRAGFQVLDIKYPRQTLITVQSFAYFLNLKWKTVMNSLFLRSFFFLFLYPWFMPLEMWCGKTERGDIIRVYSMKMKDD